MAKDEEKPTSAEKGKGKVHDVSELNGDAKKGKSTQDKDGKPQVDGKVAEGLPEGK